MKRRARLRRRGDDPAYIAWLHTQDCRVAVALNSYATCYGPIHAHHAGERGFGQRAPDVTAISLCQRCHAAYHDCRGFFAGMNRAERRQWCDDRIAEQRSRYLASNGEL